MCDSLGAILVDHLSRHDLKDKPCPELVSCVVFIEINKKKSNCKLIKIQGEPHELMELKANNEKE